MNNSIKTNFLWEQPEPSGRSSILTILGAAALIMVSFVAGWAWSKTSPLTPPREGGEVEIAYEQPVDEVVVEEPMLEPIVVDDPNALTIEWVGVGEQKIHGTDYAWNSIAFSNQELLPEDGVGPKAFGLGTVKGGQYDGYELLHYIAGISGMGTTFENYYLLVSPSSAQTIILDDYASAVSESFSTPVSQMSASALLGESRLSNLAANEQNQGDRDYRRLVLDSGSKISELEATETIKDVGGRVYNLVGVWRRNDYLEEISFVEPTVKVVLENGLILNLYNGSDPLVPFASDLFYHVRPDNRTVWYILDLGLGTNDDETWGGPNLAGQTTGIPQIVWDDGTENETIYFSGIQGGCGTVGGLNVVDIETIGELKEAGVSAAGKVYLPVSYDVERFRPYFGSWKNYGTEGEVRETLEQFAATRPFFYFQDSFGRWIEFMNTEITPMAECGKPVIYLYPETTTDLDVKLYPQGGFTYTEPVYENGWRVTASPDGTLINRDDGQVYPYLFWEGRGGMYVPPNRYWVVDKNSVHGFLTDTLARLGLNKKETADFLEFWEPLMKDFSYYKIGFYGTDVMNLLAPLSISGKPDTLIRVLMDYEPLNASIAANPPTLPPTPEREGFTVVEWGGVLR